MTYETTIVKTGSPYSTRTSDLEAKCNELGAHGWRLKSFWLHTLHMLLIFERSSDHPEFGQGSVLAMGADEFVLDEANDNQ